MPRMATPVTGITFIFDNGTNGNVQGDEVLKQLAPALAYESRDMLAVSAYLGAVPVFGDRDLAKAAAQEWTAQFNPRPVTAPDFLGLYQAAS